MHQAIDIARSAEEPRRVLDVGDKISATGCDLHAPRRPRGRITMEMKVTDGADGIVDVALIGRLDTPGVGRIELRFTATLVPRAARAIIDLSQVEFIGSMGIRMFISVARALSNKRGKMVLYAPQALVKQVLDTVSLGEIIAVTPDAASALAAVHS
jgi:anti-sigma B factor antagonist